MAVVISELLGHSPARRPAWVRYVSRRSGQGCTTLLPSKNSKPVLSVGMRETKASASSRAARSLVVMKPGSSSANFSDQAFGSESRRLFNGGPDYGAQRKDRFVNRHQINDIAHFATPGRGHRFVHGKIHRVQDKAERLIRQDWKKPEIAIHNPFKARRPIMPGDFGL